MSTSKEEASMRKQILKEFTDYCSFQPHQFKGAEKTVRFFKGHWNRHHANTINTLLNNGFVYTVLQGPTWDWEDSYNKTSADFWKELEEALVLAGNKINPKGALANAIKAVNTATKVDIDTDAIIRDLNQKIQNFKKQPKDKQQKEIIIKGFERYDNTLKNSNQSIKNNIASDATNVLLLEKFRQLVGKYKQITEGVFKSSDMVNELKGAIVDNNKSIEPREKLPRKINEILKQAGVSPIDFDALNNKIASQQVRPG